LLDSSKLLELGMAAVHDVASHSLHIRSAPQKAASRSSVFNSHALGPTHMMTSSPWGVMCRSGSKLARWQPCRPWRVKRDGHAKFA
jgi:hypothetical protein